MHVPRVVIPAARAEHDLHLHVLVREHEFGRPYYVEHRIEQRQIIGALDDLGGARRLKCEATNDGRDIVGQEGAELLVTVQRSHSVLLTCNLFINISLKPRVLWFLIFLPPPYTAKPYPSTQSVDGEVV